MGNRLANVEPPGSTAWITRNYGALVPTWAVAKLLGFPSAPALRRAAADGRLPIPLRPIPGRRGVFAKASDVATYLSDLGHPGGVP